MAALAYYALSQPAQTLTQFHFHLKYLFFALLLIPLNVGLRAYKWQQFVKPLEPTATYDQSLRSYLGAIPLSLVTPGKLGEFSRCLYFPQKALHKLEAAGLVMLDNWTDFLAVVIWSGLGFYALAGFKGLLGMLLFFVFFYPIAFWLGLAHRLVQRLPSLWGLGRLLKTALPKPMHIPQALCLQTLGIGLLAYAIEWTQFLLLLHSISEVTVSSVVLVGLIAIVTLGGSIQITFAGLGVREGLAAYFLNSYGVTPTMSIAAAFLLLVGNLLLPALIGLAFKPAVATQ